MTESFELPKQTYLDVFHAAQTKLAEGDIEGGKEFLAQAAVLAEGLEGVEDFGAYIEGTQAYIERDAEKLRSIIDRIEEPNNKIILERFLARLESGEDIDYSQDYGTQE